MIIHVLNILIFCQDTNVEVPDSTFKLEGAIDEDALIKETCELREEEIDITKTVMMLDEEELEEEEDIGEKTFLDISQQEELDIYDPAVLGKMLIHCHLFF